LFDRLRDVAMANNVVCFVSPIRYEIGKIGLFTFICRFGILKRIVISTCDFKKFIYVDLATLCKNLVRFCLVTPDF